MPAEAGVGRGVYSIGAVARMLGIPLATIHNWEERYGTIVPERSPGGHRLYSRDQMERLRFIAAEVSRGVSGAWNKLVVVIHEDDHDAMLDHALIQSRRRHRTQGRTLAPGDRKP